MVTVNIPFEIQKSQFIVFGNEHEILQNAASQIIDTDDLVCTLYMQRGGYVKLIIDELHAQNNFSKVVCVEPFGSMESYMTHYGANTCLAEYGLAWDSNWGDSTSLTDKIKMQVNITDDLRDRTVPGVHLYAAKRKMDFKFINLSDEDFYALYPDGVIYYNSEGSYKKNTYKFVYVDRDATEEYALRAINFFKDKIVTNGIIAFDDIGLYNFSIVHQELANSGFTLVESGNWKAFYKKT